jgi:hypothetical protein
MQRFITHFVLVLLFAFAQMGAATHEISHLNQTSHHQQDQNNLDDACGQCLSFAQIAGGVASQSFSFFIPSVQFQPVSATPFLVVATPTFSHLARAPPAKIV